MHLQTIFKHIPCGFSMSVIWEFDHIENKHALYEGKDWMKESCEYLREHVKNVTDFEKKKMVPLTKKLKTHQDVKLFHICGKRISRRLSKSINYWKVRDHCHYAGKYGGATHIICNLKFNVPSKIPVAYKNGSNMELQYEQE